MRLAVRQVTVRVPASMVLVKGFAWAGALLCSLRGWWRPPLNMRLAGFCARGQIGTWSDVDLSLTDRGGRIGRCVILRRVMRLNSGPTGHILSIKR